MRSSANDRVIMSAVVRVDTQVSSDPASRRTAHGKGPHVPEMNDPFRWAWQTAPALPACSCALTNLHARILGGKRPRAMSKDISGNLSC